MIYGDQINYDIPLFLNLGFAIILLLCIISLPSSTMHVPISSTKNKKNGMGYPYGGYTILLDHYWFWKSHFNKSQMMATALMNCETKHDDHVGDIGLFALAYLLCAMWAKNCSYN